MSAEAWPKEAIAMIEDIYRDSGINGVNQFFIDGELIDMHEFSPFMLAMRYALIEENEKALDWLEICYDNQIPYIITINYLVYFKNLRSEPRFIALLKKMGLES